MQYIVKLIKWSRMYHAFSSSKDSNIFRLLYLFKFPLLSYIILWDRSVKVTTLKYSEAWGFGRSGTDLWPEEYTGLIFVLWAVSETFPVLYYSNKKKKKILLAFWNDL
jgi:hypothetical protein